MNNVNKKIEFVVFCIENTAKRLGTSGTQVYQILSKTDGINAFLFPSYDVLHTQAKEYIVDEVLDYIRTYNTAVTNKATS